MNVITVREMRPEDVDSVVKLGESTTELHTDSGIAGFYTREQLLAWMVRDDSLLLSAFVGDVFAGFRLADYNPAIHQAYLEMLAVVPEMRGKGVWRALYDMTISQLRERGCEYVWCIVRQDNPRMQQLLEKEGFAKGVGFYSYEKELSV